MLEIHDLVCGYGEVPVLHCISLNVAAGEMVAIIGPNGCGKTTLLRAASGVLLPWSGRVWVDGVDVHRISPRERAKRIAFVGQNVALDFAFDVREVVLMGRSPHIRRFGWESHHDVQVAEAAMAMCDILPLADRPITELSDGERQRAFIAMALAQEPRLLLLDEPTSHLDINHQVGILDIVRGLNQRTGLTVVMVSHDLNLAAEYCDRLFLLRGGRLLTSGTPAEVLTEANINAAYGATVRVQPNPVSGRPHIVLVPGPQQKSAAGCA